MSSAAPAAGWFADPHDPSRLRWWDGVAWTKHVHPPAPPIVPSPPTAPVLQVVSPAASEAGVETPHDPETEQVIEVYYGDQREPGLLGIADRIGFSGRIGFGDRSRNGMARITAVPASEDLPFDEARERARLVDSGLTDRQVETAIRAHAKVAALMEKAAGNPLARKGVHLALRKLAYKTAQGEPGNAMDIVFDGRRYRAHGDSFRDDR